MRISLIHRCHKRVYIFIFAAFLYVFNFLNFLKTFIEFFLLTSKNIFDIFKTTEMRVYVIVYVVSLVSLMILGIMTVKLKLNKILSL